MMTVTIDVLVNGEPHAVPDGASLMELLDTLHLDPRTVVVEHNRAIVRRADLAQVRVSSGDMVELVHFVGGG